MFFVSRRAFLKGCSAGAAIGASGIGLGCNSSKKTVTSEAGREQIANLSGPERGAEPVNPNQPIKALVFDAYGTLFDVHSVVSLCEEMFPGQGIALSQTWRTRQLEYSWLRSVMGHYEDFWKVTQETLDFSCKALQLPATPAMQARLMEAYLHLQAFPDVIEALKSLSGYTKAILSNGTLKMLEAVVKSSFLGDFFSHIISVDAVKIYKPSPRVYELAVQRIGAEKTAIGFVSSNCWDDIGAKAFGFRTFWVNRADSPADQLGFLPDVIVRTLRELPKALK